MDINHYTINLCYSSSKIVQILSSFTHQDKHGVSFFGNQFQNHDFKKMISKSSSCLQKAYFQNNVVTTCRNFLLCYKNISLLILFFCFRDCFYFPRQRSGLSSLVSQFQETVEEKGPRMIYGQPSLGVQQFRVGSNQVMLPNPI